MSEPTSRTIAVSVYCACGAIFGAVGDDDAIQAATAAAAAHMGTCPRAHDAATEPIGV